ncbi:MAG: hypothetical protein ABIS06_03645 [Vicinamibacterales bacterium]
MNYNNDYTELAALDQKHGRTFTVVDWQLASEKMFTQPEALTADDLTLIRAFDGQQRAAEASQLRQQALSPTTPPASEPRTKQHAGGIGALTPDAFADVVVMAIKAGLEGPKKQIAALEQKIAALEQRPLPAYKGIHVPGQSYPACSMATRGGGLWLAVVGTSAMPGESPDWRLIVKRGEAT